VKLFILEPFKALFAQAYLTSLNEKVFKIYLIKTNFKYLCPATFKITNTCKSKSKAIPVAGREGP
jgi:hypothetical protein